MVSSEAVPYAKTGGLADVAGALPLELAKLGHDVILLLPHYRCLNESGRSFRPVCRLQVPTPQGPVDTLIEEDVISVGSEGRHVRVWTVRNEAFFDRPGLYGDRGADYQDNLDRFAFFCRVTIEVIAYQHIVNQWKTHLLHLHDWQSALCAVYLKTMGQDRPEIQGVCTVLTLHNVGYQGVFPGVQFEKTGLPQLLFTPAGLEYYGSVNLLKGGIVFADFVTTVSPTYAREILTPECGFGLEGVLHNRADQLLGILNGIDIDRWNPETDPYLPANYSVTDRSGKLLCKKALQQEFHLPETSVPLLGVIARLTSQKGLDLVAAIIPQLMAMDLQLVVLGTGEPELEAIFQALQVRYPRRMGLRLGFDEGLAHRIEGGADVFVMPSRYEPCGLSQLYSLRYGTVPVVRKTGGLADTVVPLTVQAQQAGQATGFHVEEDTASALLSVLSRTVAMYQDRSMWEHLVKAGMSTDVSWARSANAYDHLFVSLVK
ncbi:MAG: glycogen synthase GlgA [Nitrospirota bacterium]|nr:glycogen synthase GlgA [Nitrospirota bacterium]MDP2382701.1 glycogen synthase GlgA [Nitrospirota bacterium]MDP3599241.1 glycogen synthase GlgA [Nitrospirota bacterium]